ncbi:non-ribosomal peptide synthetase, partial [Aquimarina spongiae]
MINELSIETDVISFLEDASKKGITIFLQGEKLMLTVKEGVEVSPSDIETFRERKEEIREFLLNETVNSSEDGKYSRIKPFPRNEDDRIPLSFAQERLWLIDNYDGSVHYHIPAMFSVDNEIDEHILESTFNKIVNRHESLRTVFYQEKGHLFQQILSKDQWKLSYVEASKTSLSEDQIVENLVYQPFDLSSDHMLRVTLYKRIDNTFLLIIVMHHIAADGWSLPIFAKEMMEMYNAELENRPVALPELEIQYADYANWERQYLKEEKLEEKLSFWKNHLSGIEPVNLPSDYPRFSENKGTGKTITIPISASLTQELEKVAKNQEVTMYMLLLAAFQVLLSKYTSQKDISIGTPVANRFDPDIESLIGCFVNTLVLRTNISTEKAFVDQLQQVKKTTLQAYDHQDIPFGLLVNNLSTQRDSFENSLFHIMFAYENNDEVPSISLGNANLSLQSLEYNVSKFDLTLTVDKTPDSLNAVFEYRDDLFSAITIERFGTYYLRVLSQIAERPFKKVKDIDLLSEKEYQQILLVNNENNEVKDVEKYNSTIDLFTEQVKLNPFAKALEFFNSELSYAELDAKSNGLANTLINQGVTSGNLVPICVERSIDMIVGILGILKAGAAYVPIDSSLPNERIEYILKDTQADIVLTQDKYQDLFEIPTIVLDQIEYFKEASFDLKEVVINKDDVAYIIYTSGSTGKPKGVMVTHESVVNLICSQRSYFGVNSTDKILQFSSISFDASVEQIWLAFATGATLVLIDKETIIDNVNFNKYIQDHNITHLHATPTYLNGLQLNYQPSLRRVVSGGEECSSELVNQYVNDYDFYNEYGPTETTVTSLIRKVEHEFPVGSKIPIGIPIGNTKAYILDENFSVLPIGSVGELFLSGKGVTKGYLNNKELTNNRFVEDPFETGELMYRTGDLARWTNNNELEFFGRIDEQVKIRGYRIELGEIESVLETLEEVQRSVVLVHEDEKGLKKLIGYVVAEGGFDKNQITEQLKEKLPNYMIPAFLVQIEEIPLTSNGKVDKRKLPKPIIDEILTTEFIAPQSKIEREIATIWQELLGVDQIGINDNFFELGGDSIIAIQFVSRAKEKGLFFRTKDIFNFQNIAELSSHLRENDEIKSEQGHLEGEVTLGPIQEHFFQTNFLQKDHYNQSILLNVDKKINDLQLKESIDFLMLQHDALRFSYDFSEGDIPTQHYGNYKGELEIVDINETDNFHEKLEAVCEKNQTSLSLEKGELVRFVMFKTPEKEEYNRLFIVAHHIAVDGVSWRIIVEDLSEIIGTLINGAKIQPYAKTTSFREWQNCLFKYSNSSLLNNEAKYWEDILEKFKPLPVDFKSDQVSKQKDIKEVKIKLSSEYTNALLQQTNQAYNTEINDVLISALTRTICKWTEQTDFVLALEGHGREEIAEDVDLSKTVGWFTNIYPVLLSYSDDYTLPELITEVKEQLRKIPNKGLGFGVCSKYQNKINELNTFESFDFQELIFNYLGNFDRVSTSEDFLSWAEESAGNNISDANQNLHKIMVSGMVTNGVLEMIWAYDTTKYHANTIQYLAESFQENLEHIIEHCSELEKNVKTPDDYGLTEVTTNTQLNEFFDKKAEKGLVDIYKLSPLQEGILFHSLYNRDYNAYVVQISCDLTGDLNLEYFRRAWGEIVAAHSILRTGFFSDVFDTPVQGVFENALLSLEVLDYSQYNQEELNVAISDFLKVDAQTPFDLETPPLMRITLLKLSSTKTKMIITNHHLLWDGWSFPVLVNKFVEGYSQLINVEEIDPIEIDNYRDYIDAIDRKSKLKTNTYWADYLSNIQKPTVLPFIRTYEDKNIQEENKKYGFSINKEIYTALLDFTQRHHLTLNTIVQGAWGFLLSRYTNSNHVVFGATVSGRIPEIINIEERVGLYINTLPVCSIIEGESSIVDWLTTLQKGHTSSREYSHSSLVEIQDSIGVRGDLFDTIVVFENYPSSASEDSLSGIVIDNVQVKEQTNYPLSIAVSIEEALKIDLSYNPSVLNEEIVLMIGNQLQEVINSIVNIETEKVNDIEYLSATDKEDLLYSFNATDIDYGEADSFLSLFEASVASSPDGIALVHGDLEMSYGDLDARSTRLAHYLRDAHGVCSGSYVGLQLPRGFDMMVSILGILKLGCAYVPLDLSNPASRLSYIVSD